VPSFFIARAVFAWVIAILFVLFVLFGAIALRSMGVDSYPDIGPPPQ
jgi:multidrug efflux pump